MAPSASPDEVRRAYHQLARALHPDRHIGSSERVAAAAVRRMQEVNAAWAVVGSPSSRALYDAERALAARDATPAGSPGRPSGGYGGAATMTAPRVMAEPRYLVVEPPSPWAPLLRGLPWVVVLAVLGLIFVFTAFAARDGAGVGGVDTGATAATSTTAVPKARAGSCIDFVGVSGIMVVGCNGPHDGKVRAMAPLGRPCPQGTVEMYLPDDGETACVDIGG